MDILVSRTLYMSCQAGPGIEPGPSALKASALPIELTWLNTCKEASSRLYTAASCWGVSKQGVGLSLSTCLVLSTLAHTLLLISGW